MALKLIALVLVSCNTTSMKNLPPSKSLLSLASTPRPWKEELDLLLFSLPQASNFIEKLQKQEHIHLLLHYT